MTPDDRSAADEGIARRPWTLKVDLCLMEDARQIVILHHHEELDTSSSEEFRRLEEALRAVRDGRRGENNATRESLQDGTRNDSGASAGVQSSVNSGDVGMVESVEPLRIKASGGNGRADALAAYPIPLNAEQEQAAKDWAADDRLWTTQETVEFNLRTFALKILTVRDGRREEPAK